MKQAILSRQFAVVALALALLLVTGCRTIGTLTKVDLASPGWKVREGQAVWRFKKDAPELAGEVLFATSSDGSAFLQFTKTPLPFVVAQLEPGKWQIDFVPKNRKFSGRGVPPKRLGWLHLARALMNDAPGKGWNYEPGADGAFRLTHSGSGEQIEGFLNP